MKDNEGPSEAQIEAKAKLLRHLSALWPLRKPARYEDEETLYQQTRIAWETYWDPLDERHLDVVASATLLSHRVKQFRTVPYLFFYGPPHSGKSRAFDIAQVLCCHPLKTSSITPGAIYQSVDKWHPTLLLDEADSWSRKERSENVQLLLQICNSGYRKGDVVIRASRENGDPVLYDAFGLKMIAATDLLPPTLMDRCIRMDLEKNAKPVAVYIPEDIGDLPNQLEMYCSIYEIGRAAEGNPQPRPIDVDPEQLNEDIEDNRVTELFYPLYTVCPTLEGRHNLFQLAKEIVADRNEEQESGELADVLSAVIDTWQDMTRPDRVPVRDIVASFLQNNEIEAKDKAAWLGWRLKRLQLKTVRVHPGTKAVKVSEAKLRIKARRYLPSRVSLEPSQPSHLHQNLHPEQTMRESTREAMRGEGVKVLGSYGDMGEDTAKEEPS